MCGPLPKQAHTVRKFVSSSFLKHSWHSSNCYTTSWWGEWIEFCWATKYAHTKMDEEFKTEKMKVEFLTLEGNTIVLLINSVSFVPWYSSNYSEPLFCPITPKNLCRDIIWAIGRHNFLKTFCQTKHPHKYFLDFTLKHWPILSWEGSAEWVWDRKHMQSTNFLKRILNRILA